MEDNKDFTIEDYLEMIADNGERLRTLIEALELAMTLQGLSEQEIYKVSRFYATASNITAYVNGIRELIKSSQKTGESK